MIKVPDLTSQSDDLYYCEICNKQLKEMEVIYVNQGDDLFETMLCEYCFWKRLEIEQNEFKAVLSELLEAINKEDYDKTYDILDNLTFKVENYMDFIDVAVILDKRRKK